jgi:hypothetical protein
MEDILTLYEQSYDPLRPVVCVDARPCQLLSEVLTPLPMKPGRIKRQADEYERQGVCCVLIALTVAKLALCPSQKAPHGARLCGFHASVGRQALSGD